MIITSAEPNDLIDWFHNEQDEQIILCVLLAPLKEDQHKLAGLVNELFDTDANLGEKIAFLLIHPNANTPLGIYTGDGAFAMLEGTAFPAKNKAYPLREKEIFRDMSTAGDSYRKQVADEAARTMARFVPEFMGLFKISCNDCPALCVVVKGLNQSVVLPLGEDWSTGYLRSLLRSIRTAIEKLPNFQREYLKLAESMSEFKSMVSTPGKAEAERELVAKIGKISNILNWLLYRYSGTEDDRRLVKDFLECGAPSQEQLEDVLTHLSFGLNRPGN